MINKKIVVFVKNAVPGKVKTRLAKTIGDKEALEVYLRLLEITKREVLKVDANKEVWYAWDIGKDDIWEEELFSKKSQIDGDLGEKMKHAFEDSFKNGCNKMVLIGSDCPTLTSKIMEEAFAKLDENDVVFGPSEDGGYYLIGMSSYKPEVLEDIDWSTERVMEQTVLRAQETEIKLAKLQVLNDIDNEHDWNEYLANLD